MGPYLSERQWGTVRRTMAHTEMHGIIFPLNMHTAEPTAGVKTDLQASAIFLEIFVSLLHCGMAKTKY